MFAQSAQIWSAACDDVSHTNIGVADDGKGALRV